MPAPSNASVRTCWIAALFMSAASAASAHAQDVLDETPQTTLSEAPTQESALSPEEADKKARSLFEQGKAAYEDGRYRDSWDYFRRSYLLSKRPELLYNVGQSADRLRMDRESLEAFRLYLKRLPNADNRREVENRVRALEERLRASGDQLGAGTGSPETLPEQTDGLQGEGKSEQAIFGAATPPEPPPPSDGQPTRTGWQFRMALGIGVLSDAVSSSGFSASISSGTIAAQLSAGYDVSSGVVLGGGLLIDGGIAPSLHRGAGKADFDSANLAILMAFVDYYLAPRKDGWHLLGGLGAASLTLSDPTGTISNTTAGGGALIAAGGYEWPLSREWAIGGLARLVLARLSQNSRSHTAFAPSLAATVAWY